MVKQLVLAFDVYGTLFDTSSISKAVREYTDSEEKANKVTADWRTLQLEYSWRLNSMGKFISFDEVTRLSLINATQASDLPIEHGDVEKLVARYQHLECFPDAVKAVKQLSEEQNVRAVIFTNGTKSSVVKTLEGSPLQPYAQFLSFASSDSIVTAEAVEKFKPAVETYKHLLDSVGLQDEPKSCVLVSGNPFDIAGARSAGLSGLWVDRKGLGWTDQLGTPTRIVSSLEELPTACAKLASSLK